MKLRENFVRLINFFKSGLNSFRLYAEREAHAFQHAGTRGNMEHSNRKATSMGRMELFYEADSEHICKY